MAYAQGTPSISNGSMTEGDQQVSGWSDVKTETGRARTVRDTQHFAQAPAALRLESVEGPVRGAAVTQTIAQAVAGQTLTISGQVKVSGQVDFAAVAVTTPGAETTWHQVTSFATVSDWEPFSGNVTIPQGSQLALVMLFMSGNGSVWLDELVVEPALRDLPVASSPESSRLITDFNAPFDFSYLAFEKSITVDKGVAHVTGTSGQGGAGIAKSLDLSALADHSPAVWVKRGPANQARQIKIFFACGEESKRTFSYNLDGVSNQQFERLLPLEGLAVSPDLVNESEDAFDPAKITTVQVQGDWTQPAVDVFLDKIELVAPTAELLALRRLTLRKWRPRQNVNGGMTKNGVKS